MYLLNNVFSDSLDSIYKTSNPMGKFDKSDFMYEPVRYKHIRDSGR